MVLGGIYHHLLDLGGRVEVVEAGVSGIYTLGVGSLTRRIKSTATTFITG
jgi:hypothetical protein